MTKHFFRTDLAGAPRLVDVGYDRPCQHFYLNVYDESPRDDSEEEDEHIVYASVYDSRCFAPDRGQFTGGLSLDEIEQRFLEQQITPPAGLIDKLREDARLGRGNQVYNW